MIASFPDHCGGRVHSQVYKKNVMLQAVRVLNFKC